jgi:multiple sugar transport system substrate-binding protein
MQSQQLDRTSPIPVFHQLKTLLLGRILSGDLLPGARVPPEDELCRTYGLSRTPVRKALGELVAEGVITRRRRTGTFVATQLPPALLARHASPLRIVLPDRRWEPYVEQAIGSWPAGGLRRAEIRYAPLPSLREALVAAVAEGSAPDLALIDSVWVPEFARAGFLMALDELDGDWIAEYRADSLEPFVAANSRDGQLYAVQSEADVTVLWYRRDWFESEGIPPPATWADLVASAVRFRGRRLLAPLALPAGPAASETSTYVLSALLHANGAGIIADGAVVLDSREAREAMEFLLDLVRQGLMPPGATEFGWNEVARRFGAGEFAMIFGGSYELSFILEASGWDDGERRRRLGFVPVPAGPHGRPSATAGGMAYGVFRQSESPAAALDLVKRLVASDLLTAFNRATGQVPPRRSIIERLDPQLDDFLVETARIAGAARIRPPIPEYARVSAQLQRMVADVLTGRRAPDEAVSRTAEVIAAISGLPLSS